ncbi:hypothetical protein C8J56DRAFT_1064564 [Mycena floridula]|nr:hypothetical protein C8J56DRAFT_1064564 [Mycena floridula]
MSHPMIPHVNVDGRFQDVPAHGYSVNHLEHASQTEKWRKKVYQPAPEETIDCLWSVNARIVGAASSAKQYTVIDLIEGCPTIVQSFSRPLHCLNSAAALKNEYWKKDASLRNLKKWDDLGFYSPDTQYFYEECIVTKKIKGVTTRVFKKPTKLFQAYRRPSTQPSMTLPEVTIKKQGDGVSDVEVVPASEIVDLTQNFETLPTTPRLTKRSATGGVWKSSDHRALRDTLGKSGMNLPAEGLMTSM